MAKLYASEAAGRIVDRALQVLGGRGYMLENPVARFYREVRVDRIWEGTSEIQRLIVSRGPPEARRRALPALIMLGLPSHRDIDFAPPIPTPSGAWARSAAAAVIAGTRGSSPARASGRRRSSASRR